ncbi:hypothetical protein D3C83_44930 [compost metagenome]
MSEPQVLSSISRNFPRADVPALLTRMSMRPYRSITAFMKRSMSAALLMSAETVSTSAPIFLISAAVLSSFSWPRAQIATFAPSCASFNAVARPIPSVAPVITATLPFNPSSTMRSR